MPPCIYDVHTHTFLCQCAEKVMPRVYFKLASELGYKGIAYCCHNPFPGDLVTPQHRMAYEEFELFMTMYRRECAFARIHLPELDILLTMEVDYLPDAPNLTEDFIVSHLGDFDCVLGSLHYYQEIENACSDKEKQIKVYFETWVQALRTGWFQVMAHMDFIKVVVGMEWVRRNREVVHKHAESAITEMAKYNLAREKKGLDPVVLELNTSGSQYGDDFFPTKSLVAYAAKMNIPFCLSSDCHQASELGRNFKEALYCLKKHGVTELCYFKERRLQRYLLEDAIATFKPSCVPELVSRIKALKGYGVSVSEELEEMKQSSLLARRSNEKSKS